MKSKFNIDFIKHRKTYFTVSLVIILLGIVMTFVLGAKLDIEFSGGTILTYTHNGSITEGDFKASVEEGLGGMAVKVTTGTDFTSGKSTLQVEVMSKDGLTADKQFALAESLEAKYTENDLVLIQSSDISPSSGKTFFLKCLVAVIFSSIVLIIYIAVRFKNIGGWTAGVCAVIALFHDIFIVYAVFILCRMDIDANFIAVILTILGYSINDTIVIYDRIRENRRLYKADKMGIAELTNLSINQSLTRSINTSVTTVLAMLTVTIVCGIYGVSSIISFSFPVMIGMISGVYSSICISGPLWVLLEEKKSAAASANAKKTKKA